MFQWIITVLISISHFILRSDWISVSQWSLSEIHRLMLFCIQIFLINVLLINISILNVYYICIWFFWRKNKGNKEKEGKLGPWPNLMLNSKPDNGKSVWKTTSGRYHLLFNILWIWFNFIIEHSLEINNGYGRYQRPSNLSGVLCTTQSFRFL